MRRASRKQKPALGSSWGTMEGMSEGSSDSDELQDIEDEREDEEIAPAVTREGLPDIGNEEEDRDDLADATPRPRRKGGSRVLRPPSAIDDMNSSSPRRSQRLDASSSGPTARRLPQRGLRGGSVEPELVMPSQIFEEVGESRLRTTPTRRVQPVQRRSRPSSNNSTPLKASRRLGTANGGPTRKGGENNLSSPAEVYTRRILWDSLIYVYQILGRIMMWLQPLIALGLAGWMIAFAAPYVWRNISYTASNALSVCHFPGVPTLCYLTGIPACQSQKPTGTAEFDQLMTVQSAFEEVLSSSVQGATLPVDMKHSEASIRDLRQLVQWSRLPSRGELVFEFTGFIETAQRASTDLTRFNSRIGHAVDRILSVNRWTIQIIDRAADKERGRGAVARFIDDWNPFSFKGSADEIVLDQYLRHTRAIEEQIGNLIEQAQALLGILQNLDERLDIIAGVAVRDGVTVKGDRDQLFASLWVKLGGNRSSVAKFDEQLRLLKEVMGYRKLAWAHVASTILKLQGIAASLEDLRERVSAPEVVGVRKDVPLQVHIDNIQLGVERLEAQRNEAKRMEGENYRRVLDRAGSPTGKLLEGPKTVVAGNSRSART